MYESVLLNHGLNKELVVFLISNRKLHVNHCVADMTDTDMMIPCFAK